MRVRVRLLDPRAEILAALEAEAVERAAVLDGIRHGGLMTQDGHITALALSERRSRELHDLLREYEATTSVTRLLVRVMWTVKVERRRRAAARGG